MNEIELRFENVTKIFGSVKALKSVSFDIKKGEVHCLVGENGAGKSTLIKILAGSYIIDSGQVYIEEEPVLITDPLDGVNKGIAVVYQELNTIPYMTVADNFILGMERQKWGFNKKAENIELARTYLKCVDLDIEPTTMMSKLSVAQRQMVEVAKALAHNAKIIVFDEPTAFLSEKEVGVLFEKIKDLQAQGITIIYISHRMDELFQIGNRITILKDGTYVGTYSLKDVTVDEIVQLMVGRELSSVYPKVNTEFGKVALRVEHLKNSVLKDVSIEVRVGEVLGISGLVGSGRSELLRAIYGADKLNSGEIYVFGKNVSIRTPADAIANNIGMLPEDRRSLGIIGCLSVKDNISLILSKLTSKFGFLNMKGTNNIVDNYINVLKIKTSSAEQLISKLSGGNQQKVILARQLCINPKILLLDEPTQGIDIGSKSDIYQLIQNLACSGMAIIVVSSELIEICNISSRIIVMRDGKIAGEVAKEDISEENVTRLAMGVSK